MEKVTVASELIKADKLLPNLAIAPQVNLSLVPAGETDVLLAKIESLTKRGKPITDYLALFQMGVDGRGVNELLFSFAPVKSYGRDTYDILSDWRKIDYDSRRRARHEQMGEPWFTFQKVKPTLWRMIQRDTYPPLLHLYESDTYPHPIPETLRRFFDSDMTELVPETIYPLLWWRVTDSNRLKFNFSQPGIQIYELFRAQADKCFPGVFNGTNYPSYLSSVVGFWTLAHLSRTITRPWENVFQRATYSQDCRSTNIMTATQSGVIALRNASEFNRLPFKQKARDFLDRTGIPI